MFARYADWFLDVNEHDSGIDYAVRTCTESAAILLFISVSLKLITGLFRQFQIKRCVVL